MQALIPDTLWEIGGLAATIYSIGQARKLHEEQLEQSKKHHEIEMNLAKEQHKKNLVETKRVYLLELFTNLEQHFQQLNADLISSGKEAERDMFDQRNQNFQTIILASSVMFTALSTVIIDGALPTQTSEPLIVAFSLTSALSFAFLFLSMVICMELVMRASSFMYRRARNHTDQLRQAIKDTKTMMDELRNGTRNHRPEAQGLRANERKGPQQQQQQEEEEEEQRQQQREISTSSHEGELSSTEYSEKLKLGRQGLSQRNFSASSTSSAASLRGHPCKHRIISQLDERGLEREWKNHETELQRFLAERERINDATALIGVDDKLLRDDPNSQERMVSRKSFQEFWNESCKFWAELSILFFYGGTINLLLAIMVFMWGQFLHLYNSLIGAIIAISLISFALVLGIASVIGLRCMKVMELHYHPDDAKRRRIGQNNMRNLLSSSSSQRVNAPEQNARPAFRSGQLSAQNSVGTSRATIPSLSRSSSITYLPEFGQETLERDEEDIYDEDSSSRMSEAGTQDVTMANIGGIAMTLPAKDGNSHSMHGTMIKSPALVAPNSSMSGDRIPSLFRRPSPRNLFPASTDQTFQSSSSIAAAAAASPYISTPSSVGRGFPPRSQLNSRVPPTLPSTPYIINTGIPATPSTSDKSTSSNDGYPPLPYHTFSSSQRVPFTSDTNNSSSVDRRAHLGRQSSAPSSLSSPQPFYPSTPQRDLI
jgi:hypothetical protein